MMVLQQAFIASVGPSPDEKKLDSCAAWRRDQHGSEKGAMGLATRAYKHQKGEKVIAMTDKPMAMCYLHSP